MQTLAPSSPLSERPEILSVPRPVLGLTLTPRHDRATTELRAEDDRVVSAAEVVDHRTRLRVVPFGLARRGHHIGLELDGEREMLPLTERVTHVGRGLLAHLRLEDLRVSRDHAILVSHGEHLRLLDNRSSTGTFVNGRRVGAITLKDGDVVGVGPVEFRYLWLDCAPPRS